MGAGARTLLVRGRTDEGFSRSTVIALDPFARRAEPPGSSRSPSPRIGVRLDLRSSPAVPWPTASHAASGSLPASSPDREGQLRPEPARRRNGS
jgi:hypothetical protein